MRSMNGNRTALLDRLGVCIAHLSRKAEGHWALRQAAVRDIRVLAMVHRSAGQDTEQLRRDTYQVSEWESPLGTIEHSDVGRRFFNYTFGPFYLIIRL
jgi:hypothetical protein